MEQYVINGLFALGGTIMGVIGNLIVNKNKNKLDGESQIRKDMLEMNSKLIERVNYLEDKVNKLSEERIDLILKINMQNRRVEELEHMLNLKNGGEKK